MQKTVLLGLQADWDLRGRRAIARFVRELRHGRLRPRAYVFVMTCPVSVGELRAKEVQTRADGARASSLQGQESEKYFYSM